MIDDGRPTLRELLTDTLREQLREIGVDKKIDPVDVWDLEYIEEEFDRYRHRSIQHDFTLAVADAARALVAGDPTSESTDVGPMISAQAAAAALATVDAAVAEGALPVDYYEDVLASARKHKVWDEWLADALDAPQLICTECINHAYGMCAPHAVEARAYGSDE